MFVDTSGLKFRFFNQNCNSSSYLNMKWQLEVSLKKKKKKDPVERELHLTLVIPKKS